MPEFPSITHVAVTVTDLERSTRWYSELLGGGPVLDEDEQTGNFHHTVFALGGGQLFGLHTHPRAAGDRFDEYRTGLDHVAFACRDRDELRTWIARLREIHPDYRVSDFKNLRPLQRSEDLARYEDGLRKAGLPE